MSETESAIIAAIQGLEQRLGEEIASISQEVAAVNQRVDSISAKSQSSTTKDKGMAKESESFASRSTSANRPESRSWADLMDDLTLEYVNNLSFIDLTESGRSFGGEDEEQGRILELSEDMLTLVKEAWSGPLKNSQRREIRNRYPVPDTQHTKTPKLDEIFSSSESLFAMSTEAKQTDKDILQLQKYTLDVVTPLLCLMEAVLDDSKQVSWEDFKMASTDALRLLGNAVYQMSRLRHKRVLKACNPDLANLADNHDLLKETPPQLFGAGFEKNIKDMAEA